MSRIGKQPVEVPSGVSIDIQGNTLTVKGPKGMLVRKFDPEMKFEQKDGAVQVTRPSDEQRHRAVHGLSRSLLYNMVVGVSEGFAKTLIIEGTGYKADSDGKGLTLSLGYSHTIPMAAPAGIHFTVEDRGKRVVVSGIDKELVGQVAVNIRGHRPPEPYNGKGVRYSDEVIRRKAGKAGKVKK